MEAIQHHLPKSDPRSAFVSDAAGGLLAIVAYALLVWLGEDRRPDELAPRRAAPELVAGSDRRRHVQRGDGDQGGVQPLP